MLATSIPAASLGKRIVVRIVVSILTAFVLFQSSRPADAQYCGPPAPPLPFEGIPFQEILIILAMVIGLLIAIGIFIRRRGNRGIAGVAVFGIAMLAVSFASTPIITHVELVNGSIEEEDAVFTSNNRNTTPCYGGEYLCPIIKVTNNETSSNAIFSSNSKLMSLLSQPDEKYPHHVLVNYYDRWGLENAIHSLAAAQFADPSDAVFSQPATSYDSYILQDNGNYYRIFFTQIIPGHYTGIEPFTYYTSEAILWVATVMLFFYLIIWKQPTIPSSENAAVGARGREMKLAFVDRVRRSTPGLLSWMACTFLANQSVRMAVTVTAASSLLIFVTIFSIGYEAAALAIDVLIIFIVYILGVAISRYHCRWKHRRAMML